MAHLIDKATLITEIEKWLGETDKGFPNDHNLGRYDMCKQMRSFIDTLEVKEVDLEQETQRILDEHFFYPEEEDELKETPELARYIAKHFFELGLKAQKKEEV